MSRPAERKSEVPMDALAFSVDEAAERLRIGKTTVESLIASGQLKTIKIGRRRLVSRQALEKFIERLERAA